MCICVKKRSNKFKACGICSLVAGTLLLAWGIGFPFLMNYLVADTVKDSTALKENNQNQWRGIPGGFDITIDRFTHVFNCTNRDDVIYKGARPEVTEFGPFVYREYDDYLDTSSPQKWDVPTSTPGQSDVLKNANPFIFNQYCKYDEEQTKEYDTTIDQKIWQINQAAQGIWYAATTTADWRLYINILYSVVLDGLGRQVVEQAAWTFFYQQVLSDQEAMASQLFPNTGLTEVQKFALYNDTHFGLNNVNNYFRWDPLVYGKDPTSQILLFNELKAHFGLSQAQIEDLQTNWNVYWTNEDIKNFITTGIPTKYRNAQGVAYWQWCDSMVTREYNVPAGDSVIMSVDTATGYPELYYFKKVKLLPSIQDNTDLYNAFVNVQLFESTTDNSTNYEDLFNLTSGNGGDPEASSLFNITTLKDLIAAGVSVPDIIIKPTTKPTDLNLTIFQSVTDRLKLTDNKQTYLIYMWMFYCKRFTFERKNDTDDKTLGVIANIGQQAMPLAITSLEQELPLLIYTYQLNSTLNLASGCASFYTTSFGLNAENASSLCGSNQWNITTFNFSDPLQTSKAWMNIYLNNMTYAPENYADLVALTQMSYKDINTLMYSSSSTLYKYILAQVLTPIFTHYKDNCTFGANYSQCTNKELAYAQWIDQSILSNPPASLPMKTNESYVRAFPSFTTLSFTPEFGYYLDKAELEHINITISDAYTFLQTNKLYNQEIIGDVILNKTVATYNNTFTNNQTARYLKFIIIEQGLNGFFLEKTPRDYIEGYNDSAIFQMSQQPVYNGGDQLNSYFLSINQSPTGPANNSISFFSGTDDSLYTRRFARWLDHDYIVMKRKDYVSISVVNTTYENPWEQTIYLDGTDGFQFHTDVQADEQLTAFVNDLSRNGQFTYIDSDTDTYDGLEMMNFQIAPTLMEDMFENPDNAKFNTYISGTSNMSTSLQASAVASKGHFYQFAPKHINKTSIIKDKQGNVITTDPNRDNTYLGIEKTSGVNVQARQRLQINFVVSNNLLFSHLLDDFYVIPLTFVKRDSIMTKAQVKAILGDLYTAKTVRTAGTSVFCVVAVILILLGIYMLIRYKKVQRMEDLGIDDEKEYQTKKINNTTIDPTQLSLLEKNSGKENESRD